MHPAQEVVLDAVIELLECGGTDAVRLREVARRAKVSLTTIYDLYPSRDELIVSAVERWMDVNVYAGLAAPTPGEPLDETLMRGIRAVFEPWERSPRLLQAFHRARSSPGGERLHMQGVAAVEPEARAALADADPAYVDDVEMILLHVVYAVIGRVADGTLDIGEVLPTLERVVHRLTSDNSAAGRSSVAEARGS